MQRCDGHMDLLERTQCSSSRQTAAFPTELNAAAAALLNAYKEEADGSSIKRGGGLLPRKERSGEDCVWKAPSTGTVKVNVDGALFKDVGVGMGVVIKDDASNVLRSACKQDQQQWDVAVIEAKAIVLGLKLAGQCNCKKSGGRM